MGNDFKPVLKTEWYTTEKKMVLKVMHQRISGLKNSFQNSSNAGTQPIFEEALRMCTKLLL